jgi:hypothetical protein
VENEKAFLASAVNGFSQLVLRHINAPTYKEIGAPLDLGKYNRVIEGQTTEKEILTQFGDPSETMEIPDGKILIYSHMKVKFDKENQFAASGIVFDVDPFTLAPSTGVASGSAMMFRIRKGIVVFKKTTTGGPRPVEIHYQRKY